MLETTVPKAFAVSTLKSPAAKELAAARTRMGINPPAMENDVLRTISPAKSSPAKTMMPQIERWR